MLDRVGRLTISAMAALLLLASQAGGASTESDSGSFEIDPEEVAASAATDQELSELRLLCAVDSVPSQTPHKACRYVMNELLERDVASNGAMAADLFAKRTKLSGQKLIREYGGFVEAIIDGGTTYSYTPGKPSRINCATGYDAGHVHALLNFDDAVEINAAYTSTDEDRRDIENIAKQCFDKQLSKNQEPIDGFIAGVVHAVETLREIKAGN